MGSPPLRIRLLGDLDLRLGETALPPLESARAESLLAYLLLHRDAPQPRQHLAFLLWPDSTESQARTNLRHVLHTLRRALPDPDRYLDVTARTLQWRRDAPFWLDVAAFEEALHRAEREPGDGAVAALREAAGLYRGELLRGSYDEWLLAERARLRQCAVDALARLIALLEERREYAEAIGYAEHLLRHDPLHEETYQLLMRLHDARGSRARALRVYHDCVATLERELGVEPSAATRQAYEALLPMERAPAAGERRAGEAGRPPLVGRAAEWTRLTTLWRAAEGGRAQFVLVTGEPGIGKTRLLEELRAWCAQGGAAIAEARSYRAEGSLAFGPVVTWLRSDALKGGVARLDQTHAARLARLLPELGPMAPGGAASESFFGGDQRLQLFDAMTQAILATGSPLVLVADDLQWCDRDTLQFLHYLLRAASGARLLVAATARRDEVDQQHPLNDLLAGLYALERATEIHVDRLTREETGRLAEWASGRPFAWPDADALYQETEGNPLFVVEALRAGWTSEPATRRWLTPKVQSVIESRLAQLSEPARDLVGVAATIGREFTPDLLAHATDMGEETLVRGLDELWTRHIIRQQDAAAYDFSHDKIREVAYLALSPARRQRLHAAVARGLEHLHGGDADAAGAQIAAQWAHAGQNDLAIAWYRRAAEAAQKRHANIDAANLLDRALDIVRALPETPERASRELGLLVALTAPLGAVEGYASPRLANVHSRAAELTTALGVEPSPPLLRSLAVASLTQSDFRGAQTLGARLQERGRRDEDDILLVESAYVLGIAAFWQGDFTAARQHFTTAIERYRPDLRRAHLLEYGLDPKVICQSRLGNTLWFLGHAGEAARARDDAIALAEEIAHPYTLTTALVFAVLLAVEMRDLERVRADASTLAALLEEHPTRQTSIALEGFMGFLEAHDGQPAGIARIQRALDSARGVEPAPGSRSVFMRLLLEACAVAGEHRLGLRATDEAFEMGGASIWEAEIRRYRALFRDALGAPGEEIEAELDRALRVASRQKARSLALRIAVSRFHLRRQREDDAATGEALAAVREILTAWPAEDDTREVHEARLLLR